ncbi:MAG TPA: hypothetical protein DEB09_02640 [Candidatus Magasanikbacteria bacterium]|nr:hypothetical protein [Candidatus Magasanikbacteria bacterium]
MKLFKQLRQLKLTPEEKDKSLDFILARTGLVRNSAELRHNTQKVPFLILFTNHKHMIVGLLIAAILAMGGGTAAAAENSLPGDLLYPIKTQVTEEVRSALAISSEAKVAWENRRAERRLEEVEKLSSEGKLTTSTSAMLANKFEEFSKKADARLQKLQDAGKLTEEQAQKLKANFEVAVKAHDEVLSRIRDREEDREKMKDVVESLHEQASSTIKDRLEHEWELIKKSSTTTLSNVAENRKNAAQNKIDEVEKFINDNADKVSIENKAEAVKKLGEAKKLVVDGNKAFDEGKYGEAVVKYSESHRKAQEAKKYITKVFNLEKEDEVEDSTSTTTIFTTGTPQFRDEIKQAIKDKHEELKNIEQKLKEEVKQAKENLQEIKKQAEEKIKEEVKNNQEENRKGEDRKNEDRVRDQENEDKDKN